MNAPTDFSSGRSRQPVLSIGMPIYNGEGFVRETLDSILAQDCDLELVISDNGSTDATEAICREYAANDGRIKYHRYEENRGAAWNFNNCFRLARGRYFKWAAYDDKLAPGFCGKCLEVLERDPGVALAYTRATVIDETGGILREDSDRMNLSDERAHARFGKYFQAYTGHNICNPVFGIFRSEVLGRTRLIGNFLTSDRILLGEVALHGRIHEVPEGLFLFRWHPHNSMEGLSAAARILWFDPNNDGRLFLQNWVWLKNWADAIAKAPLCRGEGVRCRLALYRWAFQNADALSREMVKRILWPVLRRTPYYRGRPTGY